LALAVYDGELMAGGSFTLADSAATSHIAKWTGSQWAELDGGTDSWVQALAPFAGDLVAGGLFTSAGGVSANRIAKWRTTDQIFSSGFE
jgi:hypothetical protein